MSTTVKLGSVQRQVLYALLRHRLWSPGCGWIWDNRSTTERVLDSLVKRGLVQATTTTHEPKQPGRFAFSYDVTTYTLTEAGQLEAERVKP